VAQERTNGYFGSTGTIRLTNFGYFGSTGTIRLTNYEKF